MSTDRVKLVTETIQKLQNFVRGIQKMELDATEFAYMKALALFSPGMSFWIKRKEGNTSADIYHSSKLLESVFWSLVHLVDHVGIPNKQVEKFQEVALQELKEYIERCELTSLRYVVYSLEN